MRRGTRFAGLAAISLAACNQLFDIQERPLATTDANAEVDANMGSGVDATAEAGLDASVEATTEAGVESGAPDGAGDASACATLYVSTAESDSNLGCSVGAPKKTIGAALAAAGPLGVTAIEVCAGTYDESPLNLDAPISLRGGYTCSNWKRTSAFGYPAFDPATTTAIQNADANAGAATLTISGANIGPTVRIDGFTILGATSGTAAAGVDAIVCQKGTGPTIINNQLTGGGLTVPTGIPSAGIVVNGANPVIKNNVINGGSGSIPTTSSSTGHASVGIFADGTSTSVQIIANTINGGSGSAHNGTSPGGGAGGSIALELLGGTTGPTYLVQGNTIAGGTGTSLEGTATVGVFVSSGAANVTVESNTIDGGGGATGQFCSTGLLAENSGTVNVTGNRIYGGNCALPTASAPYGLVVRPTGASPVTVIYDNMIHAGSATGAVSSGAIGLTGVVGADIRHNTLVGGPTGGAFPAVLWLNAGTTGATVVNNVLAASGADAGLSVGQCSDGGPQALQTFENNLIFGASLGVFRWNTCYGSAAYQTIDAMTDELTATQTGATISGNLTLASSCTTDGGTDSGCLVSLGCTSALTCLETFFGGWDVSSNGYKNLFPTTFFAGACPANLPPAGNGWTIARPPPCKVSRSTVNDIMLMGLATDIYGNCRTATPSMGAEEVSGVICK